MQHRLNILPRMYVEPGREGARAPRLDEVARMRTLARLCAAAEPPWLHGEAARRMGERLVLIRRRPERILDWSGPLGASGEVLRAAYPEVNAVRVAVADMPRADRQTAAAVRGFWPWRRAATREVAEVDLMPGAADLVWSNMLLHYGQDPRALFARWQQALAVEGFLMFSTLGPGSLPELRTLHRARRWGEAMAPFIDMHDLGDMLVQARFADPVMDQEMVTLTWPDGPALLRELRQLGANLSPIRHPGLRTPRWRERLHEALCAGASDGRPRLSFELVYGHAFKTAPSPPVQISRSKP